jgi:hypothetical protein
MFERVILAHGPAQRHLLYDLLYRIHQWVVLSVRTPCRAWSRILQMHHSILAIIACERPWRL